MTSTEWIETLQLIPKEQHNQIVLTLTNGTDLVVETIFKYQPHFLLMRGRQGGSIDESRAFFVPYDQMLYFRLERIVKLKELYDIFGEEVPKDAVRDFSTGEMSDKTADTEAKPPTAPRPGPTTVGNAPAAPAEGPAVKNNLLERIRAARATSAAASSRQQSKGGS